MDTLVAKNAIYQLVTKIITAGIGFFITILIAKVFGVLGIGLYAQITAFIAPLVLLVDFGLNAFFIQEETIEHHFKDLLLLRILVTLLLLTILFIVLILLPFNPITQQGFSPQAKIGILIFSLTLFPQALLFSSTAVFQRKLRYDLFMKATIINSVASIAFILLCILLHFPLELTMGAFVLAQMIGGTVSLRWTKYSIDPSAFDKKYATTLLLRSLPLGLMLFLNLLYFRSDIFILSSLKSIDEVGIYGLANKFFDFFIAIPLFLSNALYPILLQNRSDHKKLRRLIIKYSFIFLIVSFVVLLFGWFITPLFTVIKNDFSSSIAPYHLLLLSLPFFFLTSLYQWILIMTHQQKYLLLVYAIATIINIGLNLVFIPKGSYNAAAIITGVSEGIVFALLFAKFFTVKKIYTKWNSKAG